MALIVKNFDFFSLDTDSLVGEIGGGTNPIGKRSK
jgi:hypothetical protein